MAFLKQYWPGLLICSVFILIGLMTYQNYSISTDELCQNEIGNVSYNYVFKGDTSLNHYVERDHGAGFELPLVMIENQLKITDVRDTFLARHLISHLFFLLCMLSGYFLAHKLFKNQFIACTSLLMLLLNPRLYAHSFFNSKDIPSLSVVMLIMAVTFWTFNGRKAIQFLLLGIVCGYAMSIRLMNMVLLIPLLTYIIIDIINNIKNKHVLIRSTLGLFLLLTGAAFTLYICWPTLWEHPINSLLDSFLSFSKYKWRGDALCEGILYNAEKLSWSYIPTWFFVTVPEVWLFFGVAGIVFLLAGFFKEPLSYFDNNNKRHLLLYLYSFTAPIAAVAFLQSVLYDDWRHLYFIYPPFILLAAYGMNELLQTKFKWVYKILLLVQFAFVINFIIKYHPHEYMYFNHFVAHKKDNIMNKYELDYWGLTNREGLEWVLEHSNDDSIYINNLYSNRVSVQIMTEDKRKRFVLTDDESKTEYYIENYRLYPFKYPEETAAYQIFVSNSPVLRITKLRENRNVANSNSKPADTK